MMTDITSLASATNATWSVYLDKKGVFAKSLPTGASDAVVVVAPAARDLLASLLSRHAGHRRIRGRHQERWTQLLRLVLRSAARPRVVPVLARLPRNEWTAPEEPLPPGLLWGSIVVAGARHLAGQSPRLRLPCFRRHDRSVPPGHRDDGLDARDVSSPLGRAHLRDLLGHLLHRIPEGLPRLRNRGHGPAFAGIWMGWFGWLAFPNLFTQAVGSSVLRRQRHQHGLVLLALFLFSGGFVVLLLRIVSWGGPFSRLFGKFGGEVFAQFVVDPTHGAVDGCQRHAQRA